MNSQVLSHIPVELLQGLNAGLQALPTAFRAHQKALGQFAAALLATPVVSIAVKYEAARSYSLLPRLTGMLDTSLVMLNIMLIAWMQVMP